MEVLIILFVGVLWLVANIAEAVSPSRGRQRSAYRRLSNGGSESRDPMLDDEGRLTLRGYAMIDGLDGEFDGDINPTEWFFK